MLQNFYAPLTCHQQNTEISVVAVAAVVAVGHAMQVAPKQVARPS